jgi:predicted anti-sigma-YlaC factor YlaD
VGPVTPDPCEHFQGLIAMEVIGQLSDAERVALDAHTEGCSSCRDEYQELMVLSTVLGTADPDHFNRPELPFELQTAVLDRLRAEERRERRGRRSRFVVVSAAAAVLVALVLVVTLAWPSGPTTTTAALVGLPGVHATARLTAEPWGTALDLRESGQPSGEVLSVYVRTESGSWWPMGTYRTVGSSVRVTMACALTMSKIKSVWIRQGSGRTVMHGYFGGYEVSDPT